MFIDDTGCVKDEATNHPQRRFGGIVAAIFELDYLRLRFEPGFDALRKRHFGPRVDGSLPILHLRKMKNPNPQGPFAPLLDSEKRRLWERDCLRMYRIADYNAIAVCVDKIAFYAAHPNWTGSIYEMLVGNAIERYFYFLRSKGTGDVMAEATNGPLDKVLKDMYAKFYEHGTDHIKPEKLRPVLTSKEIKIKPKSENIAGLQFADMLASTCFSHCKRLHSGGPDYDPFSMTVAEIIEESKFYRHPKTGDPKGYGRIWRP